MALAVLDLVHESEAVPDATPGGVTEALPEGAVARVNDRLISRRVFEEVLAQRLGDEPAPDASAKQDLLDELVDEELRVQRALELGLHLTDARVRMDLAATVAEAAIARADPIAPDEPELRRYFAKRRDHFAKRGLLRVRGIWIGIVGGDLGAASKRAREVAQLLRNGESFEEVSSIMGDEGPAPLPNRLLHPEELARYLNRTALKRTLPLEEGQITNPVRTLDGYWVLQMVERRARPQRTFEEARLEVEAEYWREQAERILQEDAVLLRETADIEQAESP